MAEGLVITPTEQAFMRSQDFWQDRFFKKGDAFTGRLHEDFKLQTLRIEGLFRRKFRQGEFYEYGMDLGCGSGRLTPMLSNVCGHLWAVDIVDEVIDQAKAKTPSATGWLVKWPIKFPARSACVDLMVACLCFQHITDSEIFEKVIAEIRRVLRPNARVLILDNAIDKAYHVRSRTPKEFSEPLRLLPGLITEQVTINNRPSDHWFIDGRFGG